MTTALAPVDNAAAAVVLFDQDKFDAFYAKLKADIDAVPVDLTTDKGRKAIASAAAKVRTEKASIDRDRKRLTQEWRDNTALVNNAWKGIEAKLDTLAVEARKPLTDWEEAEKARITECDAIINQVSLAGVVTLEDTAETVRLRGKSVWETVIDPERFGDKFDQAMRAKEHAVDMLKIALARLTREESERAELERLREADRLRKEEEERVAAAQEAARREAEEQRLYEERRAAKEKAVLEELEREKAAAAEQAQRQAEAAAEAERQRIQREHEEALAAERRRAEEAERARQAEVDRIAREDAARKAEADRLAAEQAARAADEAHRSEVKAKAAGALVAMGLAERTAFRVVQAICANDIPNVRLEF
ncbi:hypothetical protein [Sphingobium fuliginis]|uniref:DUF1351 domain-containing protein n=1 Tax=Sphingobium fuliginis ATCC 27551 TaxID=1208342 RepID=A0A5B8CC34_SPHSA|nr:hypothetical protein [Sphingobium fuliginis]QDC37068.1 hypothetical protein FIL70_07380 [Sphingobium fuliginis ATCC 27551]